MTLKGFSRNGILLALVACSSESGEKARVDDQAAVGKLVECQQQLERTRNGGELCRKQLGDLGGRVAAMSQELQQPAPTFTAPVVEAGAAPVSGADVGARLAECERQLGAHKTAGDSCQMLLADARQKLASLAAELQAKQAAAAPALIPAAAQPAGSSGKPGAGGAASVASSGDFKLDSGQQAKLYETFVGQVKSSKAGIQQCYVNALKKNQSIQARVINLNVGVTVLASGKISNASFSPNISADFNTCYKAIATKWQMPHHNGAPFTVESTVTLKPAE